MRSRSRRPFALAPRPYKSLVDPSFGSTKTDFLISTNKVCGRGRLLAGALSLLSCASVSRCFSAVGVHWGPVFTNRRTLTLKAKGGRGWWAWGRAAPVPGREDESPWLLSMLSAPAVSPAGTASAAGSGWPQVAAFWLQPLRWLTAARQEGPPGLGPLLPFACLHPQGRLSQTSCAQPAPLTPA